METKQYAAAGPWISVEEELPNHTGIYLLKGGNGYLSLSAICFDAGYEPVIERLKKCAKFWAEVRV